MGAIAEGIMAFAQSLIDQTDGSLEQMQKALAISQLCYNLAILPEDSRDEMLSEAQRSLKMDNEEFEAFRSSIVDPMIRRHEAMFPRMHAEFSNPLPVGTASIQPRMAVPAKKPANTDRYGPCPCNSGKKYRFCCGRKRR